MTFFTWRPGAWGDSSASDPPLFQDGLDKQQALGRRWFLLTVCTLVEDKDFFLPCATRRTRAGWGCLSALLCTRQMAWTCSCLGQVTLEVFWEVPEHFPPILHVVLWATSLRAAQLSHYSFGEGMSLFPLISIDHYCADINNFHYKMLQTPLISRIA